MTAPLLQTHGLTAHYSDLQALFGVDLTLNTGETVAIIGANGAGKTTLMRALMGELSPDEGRIDRGGIDPRAIGYLPQQAALDRFFPLACGEVVAMGHWGRVGPFRRLTDEARARIHDALAAVGLDGFARRPLATLSAGQFQRVLFARMLLQDAPVVLLDEPFTAIDARTTADLMRVVTRWHGEGRTVIAVLHDLDLVRARFPDALLLARGKIAWGKTAEALSAANLFRARMMAEAWDEDAGLCEHRAA